MPLSVVLRVCQWLMTSGRRPKETATSMHEPLAEEQAGGQPQHPSRLQDNSQDSSQAPDWEGEAVHTDEAIAKTRDAPRGAPVGSDVSPLSKDDWWKHIPPSSHVDFFIKARNGWEDTLLGPLNGWSYALRLHVFTVLADSRASCVYWGPQRVAIYNENFIPLAAQTHPSLMGATFEEGFPEIWQFIQPVFDSAETTGVASVVNEMEMFVQRNDFLEEAFFTGNFTPLRGDSGKVEGFYNSVIEVTKAKIGERRRITLNMMQPPSTEDKRRLADHLIPPLKDNPRDFPLVMTYRTDKGITSEDCILTARGSIGVPSGHPLAVEVAPLSSNLGIMPLLRRAGRLPLTVPVDETFAGIEWTGYGEASKFVTILPISDSEKICGFLLYGTNPRRPIDGEHDQFVQDLTLKFNSLAAAILTADETRKREAMLQKELAGRMRQIRYMAENASIGMQYLDVNGNITWANDEYYRLSEHSRAKEDNYSLSFLETFVDEDRAKFLKTWTRLVQGEPKLRMEMRLKRKYLPPKGDPEPAIVLIQAFRVVEDGKLVSLIIFTTDVSAFKWAEASEARKALAAQEAKHQQEEFIDFVSHELRNPLSAIFQLAETIMTSFPTPTRRGNQELELTEALNSNIDNAKTILMCAHHQKRIVDDVLTLSKLEYTMLSVFPQPVQATSIVAKWLKMFEAQLISSDITIKTSAHSSIENHNADWILCDESRVQQIFINLMTNAIKFTRAESKRDIQVEYGVTGSNPRESFSKGIKWAPNHRDAEDLTVHPEWGTGEPLYFTVSVTDSGIGMTSEEINTVFGRFKQANARTSVKYGGSGLGLFLSGRLAEKQSGEIGVASQFGKGSTFAFYVKSRRTNENGVSSTRHLPPALPSRPRATSIVAPPTKANINHMHVLLVEDNIVNQQVIRKQLQKAGCIVHVANHGLEALDMIRISDVWHEPVKDAKHLDIILMDWQMPVMDGLTCSREIRRLEAAGQVTGHVQIIATTANAREEQVKTALASGIDAVVSKPFMVSDLLVQMKERLSNSSTTAIVG